MTAPTATMEEISALIASEGDFIVGAGKIADLHSHFRFAPTVPLAKLTHAISIVCPLSGPIMEECDKRPTALYKHHYKQVNTLLDRVALRVQGFISSRGRMALPVPASVLSDWGNEEAHLSHKMIALRTGIGWIGKNILLITPEYGARVRLTTVLTDIPLETPPRPKYECGACAACAAACPVGAIGKSKDDFNLPVCSTQCREFERRGMGVRICGVCVRACAPGLGRPVGGAS